MTPTAICRLTRNYSIASFFGIALVAAALVFVYHQIASRSMMAQRSDANSALAQNLSRVLWPHYHQFIREAGRLDAAQIRARPEVGLIKEQVTSRLDGLGVVKVKIYDGSGMTVFSTEEAQIGSSKRGHAGYDSAMRGEVVSEIAFRDQFSAFEGVIRNRDLVASYVPVRDGAGTTVDAVFEIYSDVTPLVAEIRHSSVQIFSVVVALLFILYLSLVFIVRRAERVIRAHEAAQKQAQEEKLRFLTHHDGLTGLPNRTRCMELLALACQRARHYGAGFTLAIIDLDHFRQLNLSLGQALCDRLLLEVVKRVSLVLSQGDSLCRIGPDEFALILEGVTDDEVALVTLAQAREFLSEPLLLEGQSIGLMASIGYARFPQDTGEEGDEAVLLTNAQLALQRAQSGGGLLRFSHEWQGDEALRREMEAALHQALANGELRIHYQPKVAPGSGIVAGVEALVRWESPRFGLVLPTHFIGLLEASGDIITVGTWVLRHACQQCVQWRAAGLPELHVAVNISAHQLHDTDLLGYIEAALHESGLPAHALELEITESALVRHIDRAVATLTALKRLGVRLSIDDFGTGYSSLSYLMHFPVDTLKIDRSFVRDVARNREHRLLTSAVINMAKSLGLTVVVEGVEAEGQLRAIQELGADLVQGFYYSPAVAAALLPQVIESIPRPLMATAGTGK